MGSPHGRCPVLDDDNARPEARQCNRRSRRAPPRCGRIYSSSNDASGDAPNERSPPPSPFCTSSKTGYRRKSPRRRSGWRNTDRSCGSCNRTCPIHARCTPGRNIPTTYNPAHTPSRPTSGPQIRSRHSAWNSPPGSWPRSNDIVDPRRNSRVHRGKPQPPLGHVAPQHDTVGDKKILLATQSEWWRSICQPDSLTTWTKGRLKVQNSSQRPVKSRTIRFSGRTNGTPTEAADRGMSSGAPFLPEEPIS
jgi:hypothetical protein